MFVKDVRLQIAITLAIITSFTLLRFFSLDLLVKLLATLLTTHAVELLFLYFTKKKVFLSYSAIVTALLIFLLWQGDYVWSFILASALAVSSKHILKIGPSHIFNPASFGLIITSLITGTPVSWWGISWNWILIVILYLGTIPVLKRLRRLYIVGGFLVVYFLFALLTTKNLQVIQFLWDPTIMLFALVMLPEPMTTPVQGHWIKTFGIYVGIFMIILIDLLPTMNLDPLLTSLLLANLTSYLIRKYLPNGLTVPITKKNA